MSTVIWFVILYLAVSIGIGLYAATHVKGSADYEVLAFVAAWVTMMFGSIPQQDVFQRVMSAKNVNTAVAGSVLGGSLYSCSPSFRCF
jgi:Na+/proline symporter